MLSAHLTPERLGFAEGLSGWREAIELVSAPLVADGSITRSYVDAMLESIAAGGTYIDLGYGIALAHARPERGVVSTALSALWVRPSVLLNDEEEHPISLFFCLAAADDSSHLATMSELAMLLSDDAARDAFLTAKTPADVSAIIAEGVSE